MKFDFVVLGATGMQGRIVAKDLLQKGYTVLLCGRDKSRVEQFLKKYKKTAFAYIDIVKDPISLQKIIERSSGNVVINCMEGDWNANAANICIAAGVHSIDLGSDTPGTKKQFDLDKKLKKKNLIHITGCGSVPGIGNVMLRYAKDKLNTIDSIDVGFAWDSNQKVFVVPFSIQSILEEFVTPADMIINKNHTVVTPMSTIMRVQHRSIEKEPQFNVGHHPETFTFYKFMKDKGIKNIKFFAGFPQHSFRVIDSLVKVGFTNKESIEFGGRETIPINFLTEMFKKITYPKGYTEKENLWVHIYGKKDGKKKTIKMECIVPTLNGWEDAGCNIDTGLPASIIAQMIKNKIIIERGAFSPEFIVPPELFFQELKKREMIVYENGKRVN